jgi:molecular chaperone GrpE (heat shock protein)
VRGDVVRRLLPLMDNFERAAASLKPATPNEAAIQDAYQEVPKQALELFR